MLNNINLKERGFTIVELLIVIVVIAILAAISIVAYSGIQNRARNSAGAELANQFQGKVRAFESLTGAKPTGVTSNQFTGYVAADHQEADISGIVSKVTVDTTTAAATEPANPATGDGFWNGEKVIWQTTAQKIWYRTGASTKAALTL